MKVGLVFSISYAHRLMNHPGKCANLHGHNGKVEIEIEGLIDPETGMTFDFDTLKMIVRDWTVRHFDHTTILQEGDPLLDIVSGRLVVMSAPPTAEILSTIILKDGILKQVPGQGLVDNKYISKVRFWETESCYAEASSDKEVGFEWYWDMK